MIKSLCLIDQTADTNKSVQEKERVADHDVRASVSTLNFDAQSVRTASSTSTRAKRPTRGSIVTQNMEVQSNITSSTFYNRP